jgi:hypothetical protein
MFYRWLGFSKTNLVFLKKNEGGEMLFLREFVVRLNPVFVRDLSDFDQGAVLCDFYEFNHSILPQKVVPFIMTPNRRQ